MDLLQEPITIIFRKLQYYNSIIEKILNSTRLQIVVQLYARSNGETCRSMTKLAVDFGIASTKSEWT